MHVLYAALTGLRSKAATFERVVAGSDCNMPHAVICRSLPHNRRMTRNFIDHCAFCPSRRRREKSSARAQPKALMTERHHPPALCGAREALMPHYRLYSLDSDNRVTQGTDLEGFDDDAAFLVARARFDDTSVIELWSGARRVGRVSGSRAITLLT
jgi:hypothetical protein